MDDSNTSHVLIYRCALLSPVTALWHSNTSHVLIYLYLPFMKSSIHLHSNTSHVLIYRCQRHQQDVIPLFKYISCSYLSIVISSWFWEISDSNTSHVLIYPTYFRHSSFPLYEYFLYFTRFSPYFPKCFALYFLLTPQSPNVLYLQQSSAFHLYWRHGTL